MTPAAGVRIEHVALWTDDIERLAQFYSKYLGADVGPLYANPAKGYESRFLSFGSGARLELMRTSQLTPVRHEHGAQRMGLTHLAIALGAERRVDELTGLRARRALWCWTGRGAPETATMRVWFWIPTAIESSSLSEPTTSKP